MPDIPNPLRSYRHSAGMSQAELAVRLGVTQAYVSQLESGARPVSRKVAARLSALAGAGALSPTAIPPDVSADLALGAGGPADAGRADADFAATLGALGCPGFPAVPHATPLNPAVLLVQVLERAHVSPAVTGALPWILLTYADLDIPWLVDRARLGNLQNRLGFLTDLALDLARARLARRAFDSQHLARLEALREDLDASRLMREDTLARALPPAERQFFAEHRSDAARYWNLVTGLTRAQLPYR